MKAIQYVFILSVLLIVAVYYIGLSTDATTVGPQIRNIINTVTGRNTQGQFAAYPVDPNAHQ